MFRPVSGFSLVDVAVVAGIVVVSVLVAPPAYRKFQEIAANSACMSEVQQYARDSLRAILANKPPGAPRDVGCTGTTDASAGGSIDTDIFARPRPPGTGTISCDLNVNAACKQH